MAEYYSATIRSSDRFRGLVLLRDLQIRLFRFVDAVGEIAHGTIRITHKAVAGREFTIGGDAEIARPGNAWIGSMRAFVDLLQGADQIREGIAANVYAAVTN